MRASGDEMQHASPNGDENGHAALMKKHNAAAMGLPPPRSPRGAGSLKSLNPRPDDEFHQMLTSGAVADPAQAAGNAAVASTGAELEAWMADAAASASHLPAGQQHKLEQILQASATCVTTMASARSG
eukprot:107648-Pleurochrysis_carterae.AAC.1